MTRRGSTSRAWRGRVVVVTGASAGVGRAVALRFAALGAKVGLLARDAEGLADTRTEIEARGGQALDIPTDVADADAVFAAADSFATELGPIGVWVNNAMVTVFSPVADLSVEEVRRVTEVTYLGTVHDTMAALRHMRRQRHGTIVQVGSGLAYRAIPLQSAYCGAKHAIRGFTDALRSELLHEGSRIKLTTVHLPAINTPQFDWARTHRPNQPRPVAPVYQPEVAAHAIVHAAAYPRREYWVGGQTPFTVLANYLAPGILDHVVARQAYDGQDTGAAVPADRADNLFVPVKGKHHTRGTFGLEARAEALMMPGSTARLAGILAIGAAAAALGACFRLAWRQR